MNSQEKDFERYLGGAPKAVVKEFPKPSEEKQSGEFTEEDIIGVIGGLGYGVSLDYSLKNSSPYSQEILEREKETAQMLGELEQEEPTNSYKI